MSVSKEVIAIEEQISIFSLISDFNVGDKVFFVSLDNVFKATITAVGRYVEWTCDNGQEWYCVANAANKSLFQTKKEAKEKAYEFKRQFRGYK